MRLLSEAGRFTMPAAGESRHWVSTCAPTT